jgi:4-hydroxybenzoate polyprenyltransferase
VIEKLIALVVSMRPRQWLKNLSLFAAVVFGGELFDTSVFYRVIEAFLAFCFLSSSAYVFNDIADRKRDRKHPLKRERPIAKGELPTAVALVVAVALAIGPLAWMFYRFNRSFFLVALAFITLQLSYSVFFRRVIILDAMVVAMAFVLRVYSGAFVVPTPTSSWLILAVIGLALLLAFGKRRSERTLLSSLRRRLLTRETLRHYPDTLLDSTISMSAAFTTISYAIFAFQTSPMTSASQLTALIPSTLANPKWMMLTIPLVIYGVARYLYVIYEKKEGESPEKVLITDLPLLGTVLFWIALSILITYGLT